MTASVNGSGTKKGVVTVPAISAIGISKRFPGLVANDHVTFDLQVGEIHALLGENGSGKTTLCKILAGLYHPDAGSLAVNGRPVKFSSPRQAHEAGIFMVQQHFSLVPRLTVAENMVLGVPRSARPKGRAARAEAVRKAATHHGLHVDPDRYVWQLSVGERQRVEILKSLFRGASILILDEPTTVLTPQESEVLFTTMRQLATAGTSIIFVSHKLREVLSVADRVSVLRRAAVVASFDARRVRLSTSELALLMVGRNVELSTRSRHDVPAGTTNLLTVDSISSKNDFGRLVLEKVSISVAAGEIVGVAGVAGNGQRELAEVIAGLRLPIEGTVRLGDRTLRPGSARDAIHAGIAYVPEDRFGMGLVPNLSVADNLLLKHFRRRDISRWSFFKDDAVEAWADRCIEAFSIKGKRNSVVRQLSGGNAQKVVLARELSSEPRVLVVANPTHGLDVGATDSVRRYLIDAADAGMGILLISEDLDELLDMADRLVVMYHGAVVGDLRCPDADRVKVGLMMAGAA